MKKNLLIFLIIFCIALSIPILAAKKTGSTEETKKSGSSGDTVTFDNDGYKRSKENCYGDSKVPSSYNISYYDCYLPYNLTPKDIGGYSKILPDGRKVKWYSHSTYDYCMESYYPQRIKQKFTHHINGYSPNKAVNGTTISQDPDTGACLYTDSNGNKFYGTAIQHFFYNTKKAKIGWGSQNGQIFDAILTNGTVIHFIVTDANAIGHTNGGPEADFDVGYLFADMKLEQYKNIFHAAFGNTIELTPWGNYGVGCSGFAKKFFPDGVEIAYYRMFNAKVSDQKPRAAGVPKDASYNLGNVNIQKGQNQGEDEEETESLNGEAGYIPDEWDLHGMPDKELIKDEQQPVELPQNIGEIPYQVKMQDVRENMDITKQNKISYIIRVLVVSLGLFVLIYMVLLIGCWIMDKANNIFDFSFVSIITFGVIKPTEAEAREGGVLSVKRLIIICIFCLIVAFLLITGGVFDIGQFIMNKISAIV